MPGFAFYLFMGFGTTLLADDPDELGLIGFAGLIFCNLAALIGYFYVLRLRTAGAPAASWMPVAGRFLYLAPGCYVLGAVIGLSMKIY
jgi:hypothetical protein